jgi:hypothetical protein
VHETERTASFTRVNARAVGGEKCAGYGVAWSRYGVVWCEAWRGVVAVVTRMIRSEEGGGVTNLIGRRC